MLKRIVKYSVGILLLGVVVLLVAPFFIDTDQYRRTIEQEFTDATGRALHIEKLKASLFPWVGVTLEGVRLENRQGFSDADMLQVRKLDVQVALLPLLHSSVEIKRFLLDAPQVHLEVNAKDENNWQDLLGQPNEAAASQAPIVAAQAQPNPQAASQDGQQGASMLAALSAELMDIQHATVSWTDSTQHLVFHDINMQLKHVQLKEPIALSFSAKFQQDEMSADAQIGPLGSLEHLDMQHLPLQMHLKSAAWHLAPWHAYLPKLPASLMDMKQAKLAWDAQVEQRPDGVRLLAGTLHLNDGKDRQLDWKMELNHHKLTIHQLDVALNHTHVLDIQGKITGLNQQPKYQLRLKTATLTRETLMLWLPALQPLYAGNPKPWEKIQLGASLAGDANYLDIRDMQWVLNDEVLQVSGEARWKGAPDIRLHIAAKDVHLDAWLPQSETPSADAYAQPTSAAQAAAKPEAIEPDLRFLKDWRVSLRVQMEHLFVKKMDIAHLHMVLDGEKGLFALKPLQFELAGGSVSEQASMDVRTYPVRWQEHVSVTGMQLKPVLLAVAESDMLDGLLTLSTQLHATGVLPEHIRKGLEGQAQVTLLNGSVKGFDIAGGLRRLTSFGKASPAQKTDFAQLQGSFRIHQGIMKNNDLFMASPLFRLSAKGVIRLPDLTLDYHARPKLVGTLMGQGDAEQRHGMVIPLHLYGAFDALQVKPEFSAKDALQEVKRLGAKNPKLGKALQKVSSDKVQKILQQVTPAQQDAVKQGLQRLFGR